MSAFTGVLFSVLMTETKYWQKVLLQITIQYFYIFFLIHLSYPGNVQVYVTIYQIRHKNKHFDKSVNQNHCKFLHES